MIAREVGLEAPGDLDGVPLGERRVALAEFHHNPSIETVRGRRVDRDLVAVIEWPWKLIRADDGTAELFRIDGDPGEQTDLFGRADNAEAQRTMGDRVDEALSSFAIRSRDVRPAVASPLLRERLRVLGYLD